MSSVLHNYIQDIRSHHGPGVKETTHYPTLQALLRPIAANLKPAVIVIQHPANIGAGIPDMGLFSSNQIQKNVELQSLSTAPERGVIEVKGLDDDVLKIAKSAQVEKYCQTYGQVLVTNYRDFIVTRYEGGKVVLGERYTLAKDSTSFLKDDIKKLSIDHETSLNEFLARALQANVVLSDPKQVAQFLASYARDARARLELANINALKPISTALENALGISFSADRGEHFFRSTLVQTLFYGLFSAWVLWQSRDDTKGTPFNWRLAGSYLHIPLLSSLFSQIILPNRIKPLNIEELLNWATNTLNRIDTDEFFLRFANDSAVQYFYEPFLEAFDPQLRRDLGVWYTPPEIVRYQVARVDQILRDELGIINGLADEQVVVLDPCCGTGTYLVEVVRFISQKLKIMHGDDLIGEELKKAMLNRLYGFELLPAPFVVAHLQLGLLLQHYNAPLDEDANERVGVYLTNALTGWQPLDKDKEEYIQGHLQGFPELSEERDQANEIKRKKRILVILGNPPYSGYAGISDNAEERALTDAYRKVDKVTKPNGQGLNDLYVRFFRMAEQHIVGSSQTGIISYISNSVWLNGLSFTGMREHYMNSFNTVWVDNLNGDKFKTGKVTPEGLPDPSVFSTETNREGIQVGTAIATLVRKPQHSKEDPAQIYYREFWGQQKRQELEESLKSNDIPYNTTQPNLILGLPFTPTKYYSHYTDWPLLTELLPLSFSGVATSRDADLVNINKNKLIDKMQAYFDASKASDSLSNVVPTLVESTPHFNAQETRNTLLLTGFSADNLIPYTYRPFDIRWLYWEQNTKLLNRARVEYKPHVFKGNVFLAASQQQRRSFDPPFPIIEMGSYHLIERGTLIFPLYLKTGVTAQQDMFDTPELEYKANLSDKAQAYLQALTLGTEQTLEASHLFYHIVALLHSPAYAQENSGALLLDWPRVALPKTAEQLASSAQFGAYLVQLLDVEQDVAGVTAGAVRSELQSLGLFTRENPQVLGSDDARKLTANWGFAGQGGATMAGRGKLTERSYNRTELDLFANASQYSAAQIEDLLGDTTYDIYLNEHAYWRNVPSNVWEFSLGGYQVLKKWLSYREHDLLERPLSIEEVRYFTKMVRRIAELLLLGPSLDANYHALKVDAYQW